MGKDKTKDWDAATSTETNRDHSRDQEAARDTVLARTITKAVVLQTQSITEVFARQMSKAHAQYQDFIKENRTPTLLTTLKVTLDQLALESWTPLIGQWTRMSTRDGNFGHTRLDSPLKLWKETLRRPRSPTCTIGLMVKEFQRLNDGKTAKSSSASQTIMN